MSSESEVKCPFCQGASSQVTSHSPFAYWRCIACGTSQLHPKPSKEFLADYYERFHEPDVGGGIYEKFEGRTAADFPQKANIVARSLPGLDNLRVLDVGCGKGFFLRELQRHGLRVEGIDLSATAVGAGANQGISGLRSGRIEEQDDWAGAFDAVTSWATIEHLLDPHEFIGGIRRVLKPGGLLFMDTGVGNDLIDRVAPGFAQWYDPPQHIFVFSIRGMNRLLNDCGFEILRIDENFERSAVRRLAKSLRNSALALTGGALFRILSGSAAYQKMRRENKMPFGSLMLIVARSL